MSPDLDAGLLRGVDGSRVAGLSGHGDRHPHHSADYSPLEPEVDYSPNSDASSSHLSYPPAHHDSVPTAPHHILDSSKPENDSYKSHRGLQAAQPRPSQLPHGEDVNGGPSATRAQPRSNLRSSSSPLDSKSSVPGASKTPTGKPSVKDLKKRFDQNGGAAAVSKPQVRPGNAPRSTRPTVKTANGTSAHSDLRASSSQDAQVQAALESGAATRAQRSKFVAQAAVPGSSQSFASRIGKPRSSIFGKVPSSKSMTQLPHRGPHPQMSSSPPTTSRPSGLLFGEIPPGQRSTAVAGFGIPGTRPRRTSEASNYNLASHHRSFSGPDEEQPLPSNWYRHVDAPHNQSQAATGAPQRLRNRSRSDAAPSLASIEIEISCNSPHKFPASTSPDSSSASKLPVSVRKLSSSTNPTSPPSTRSNSPSALKCSLASARVSGANTGATSRATSTDIRAKTPTQTGRKPPPQALATPDNGRLQAYIAVPPPKLSPPLRSSRPRLPISTATAVGLRIKESDRARSRDRLAPNGTKTDDGAARRRKISFGPIDFEQRREHIRLAYSKSIRESEALEERQVAAERRRRESEVTKAIVSAEAINSPSAEAATAASLAVADTGSETEMALERRQQAPSKHYESESSTDPTERSIMDPAPDPVSRPGIPPLTVHTALDSAPPPSIDSPTLGVPGSFPSLSPPATTDEQPLSAVSGTSETTEFDVEPQTNPPIQAHSPLDVPITVVKPPSPEISPAAPQAEYQYPFEDETDFREQTWKSSVVMQEPAQAGDAQDTSNIPSVDRAVGDELVEPEPSRGAVVSAALPTEEETGSVENHSTIPFPRLDAQDESDCHSDLEPAAQSSYDSRHDDDGATDACTEETDDGDRAGYRQSDFRLDELSSHRTSTCASSDVGALDDMHEPALDRSQGTVNPSTLAVPRSRLQNDRFSQQSAWTDFSVDSMDASDNAKSLATQSRQGSPSFGHVTIFGSRATARESFSSSKDTTSGVGMHMPEEPKRSSMPVGQTQLPEVDTGGGFFVPSLSPGGASASLSFLPSPNHEPPPVPVSASASALNSRRSSVFYDQSQYGSTLIISERGADDFASPLESPQSLDVAPTEPGDQCFGGHTTADGSTKSLLHEDDGKERHRLIQRHNVIKELIDTEAVFVRDMNIVEEIYKGTAEACPRLDSKTVKLIFRNSDEIIQFHTYFLKGLKGAVASVYVPVGGRSSLRGGDSVASDQSQRSGRDARDSHDRATSLGPVFQHNVESMKLAHEGFLRNSDQAAKRLIQIQQDPTVKVWLNECNEVAKDLTAAWDLDSLLIKPMQRITKYPNLIMTLLQHTPQDHPDREALLAAKDSLETAIVEINRTKKNFELVGQIVGRKRKESDVKAGFARAFGKRVDKLQASNNRPPEDQDYVKLHEKFGDDYLRLQVVLRDVEFYTRQVSAYVHEFLQYLSSVELVMRLQPGNYPELESKWVQFNISVRDLEKVALEEHLLQVRKHVIEPFELVIKAYGNPSLAMKKRQKRRLDYERSEQLKRAGRTADPKLRELVEQYEALNDTLKKELPALSALTEKVGNICLGNFVNIQTDWYAIWKEKMRTVLGECPEMPDLEEVVSTFQRDYPYARDQLAGISILNPTSRGRLSQSTTSMDDSTIRSRGRGLSVNGDAAPTLPAPDFGGRRSGSFSMSANPNVTGLGSALSSPHHYYYRDYYAGIHAHQGAPASSSRSPEMVGSSRSLVGTGAASTRPSTGRSLDSGGAPRQSSESANQHRRDSNTTYNSSHPPHESRRYSNIFHSALPLPDGPEDSRRSSRASSRERNQTSDGYNILWLAASLFEFNISTTKHEAGYPYLTYQAGEIFDVIAEKGELWLAKNQDDATDQVGWIWSKHFAKLADS